MTWRWQSHGGEREEILVATGQANPELTRFGRAVKKEVGGDVTALSTLAPLVHLSYVQEALCKRHSRQMQLISALRRSLSGGTNERISNSANSKPMDVEGGALHSMEGIEHPDADSEDGFYEVLHNIFPSSSPHHIYCSNSQENLPSESQMADLGERSSSHENLEYFSGTEECEDPADTSLPKASSSKKIQACSTKSVAVQCEPITYVSKGLQCEPITYVSKGVQWEPLLMVSQSVQCMPLTQVVKEVQCFNTFNTQCEQSETVSLITTGVQCEYQYTEEETVEKQSNTSKQLSGKVPIDESEGVDCKLEIPSTSKQCGSKDQKVLSIADLSITLPSLLGELDVESSSEITLCIDSSSQGSNDKFAEDKYEMELKSSQLVPSTSGVKCKRKSVNRVRKMKRSIKTKKCSSSSEGGHAKRFKKRTRTDGNQFLTESVISGDCDNVESESIQEKEAENVKEMLCSPLKETSSSDKNYGEKLVVEESSEELLQQMGNSENCLAKEDTSNKKNGALEICTKDKQLETASQKIINSSCPQSDATRDVTRISDSQRSGGMNWFSSLACERFSSPEIFGEDVFEELQEDRSNCNNNLALTVQPKSAKSSGFCKSPEMRKKLRFDANDKCNISASSKKSAQLVPYSDSDSGPESCVDQFSGSEKEAPKKILKKQQHSKTTPTKKSQKSGIIPSEPWMQKKHTRISCDRESLSRVRSPLSNSENSSGKNRPADAVVSTSRREDSESESSGESDIVSRSRRRRVLRKKKNILTSSPRTESNESENSEESDIVSTKKIRRIQENKLNVSPQHNSDLRTKSGYVGVSCPEVSKKHPVSRRDPRNRSPVDISMWSSDEGVSCRSTVAQQNSGSRTKNGNVGVSSPKVRNKQFCSPRKGPRKESPVHISMWSSDEDVSCPSTVSYSLRSSKGSLRRRTPYVKEEREAIVWYIVDHKYYKLVKGKAMWERMEKDKVCIDRSWQSMKEHFIKKILPQIETFNLSPEIIKKFVSVRK